MLKSLWYGEFKNLEEVKKNLLFYRYGYQKIYIKRYVQISKESIKKSR